MRTTPEMIAAAIEELHALLVKKNFEYHDVYAHDGIRGVFADLQGKYVRLKTLVAGDGWMDVGRLPSIRDAFLDLAGYGLLGLIVCDHPEIVEEVQRELGGTERLGPEIFKGFKQDGTK